jgi:hypothetical protein
LQPESPGMLLLLLLLLLLLGLEGAKKTVSM